jgi:hypothetical protein
LSKYTFLSHFWQYIYLTLGFQFLFVLSNFCENKAKLEVWNSINIHKICFCYKMKSLPCTYSAEHLKAQKKVKLKKQYCLFYSYTWKVFSLICFEIKQLQPWSKNEIYNCRNVTIWRRDTYRQTLRKETFFFAEL